MAVNNNSKYGNLLDQYMDDKYVDYGTTKKREVEAEDRYGDLLNNEKPNKKLYDDMLKVDNMCRNLRQHREDEYEQAKRKRQEQIEREKADLQERKDKHDDFINDYLRKKETEDEAVEKKKKEKAEKEDLYKKVERLANIDPHVAEVYVQTLDYKYFIGISDVKV